MKTWKNIGAVTAETSGPETLRVVSLLVEAGRTDTVYRDLYLQRACAFLAPLLPHLEYLHLEQEKVSIDNLLRQSRAAVERGQWSKVKELAGHISISRADEREGVVARFAVVRRERLVAG